MIFATVGTHEQQFNRLLKALDKLKQDDILNEEVIIQTGYSDYSPELCESKKMLSYEEMNKYAKDARIIITHGGPASIFLAYNYNKIPIVVPRQKKYDEHVDNHQLLFARRLSKEKKIIIVEEVGSLRDIIINFDKETSKLNKTNNSNNSQFMNKFKTIVNSLV